MDDDLSRLQTAFENRYELKSILGRGGMATVYLAEEPRHSRLLAVKVLRRDLASTIGAERFLREIKTIASLTHPHVLPLFDSGEVDGLLYYVMPYVDGETLRQRIERMGKLPIDEAVQIASEVADALSFAHGRGIVHRDIKPENVLLEAGHAVVADFGIAKAMSFASAEQLTGLGFAVGTPKYMSPEQAAADPSLDGRSDQYSLACVLFEMLSGEPPFAGSASQAMFIRKFTEPAPLIRTRRAEVPTHLENAIGRALQTAPANRFPTMLEFSDALSIQPILQSHLNYSPGRGVPGRDLPRLPIEIRPLDAELDVYGLTHPGKVELVNQDHFMICSVRREMFYHSTSLPDESNVPRHGDRRALIAIVADGIGRGRWGEQASRIAIEILSQQLMRTVSSYTVKTPQDETEFLNAVYSMAVQCQFAVEQRTWDNVEAQGSSFGLTMWIGMWPRGYAVQLGGGSLLQLVEGDLYPLSNFDELDEVTRERAMNITGSTAVTPDRFAALDLPNVRHRPKIYCHNQRWQTVGLLCTSGLTDNVSPDQIKQILSDTTSAKEACESLLEAALTNGGSRNITVVVGRSMPSSNFTRTE